jgi:hypothetical protein
MVYGVIFAACRTHPVTSQPSPLTYMQPPPVITYLLFSLFLFLFHGRLLSALPLRPTVVHLVAAPVLTCHGPDRIRAGPAPLCFPGISLFPFVSLRSYSAEPKPPAAPAQIWSLPIASIRFHSPTATSPPPKQSLVSSLNTSASSLAHLDDDTWNSMVRPPPCTPTRHTP